MNRLKLIFNQTLMVSTAILFGLGLKAAFDCFVYGDADISWQWYIPLTIIFTGFLCSVPSVIFLDDEKTSKTGIRIRCLLHFLALFGVVSLCGRLFGWYSSLTEFLFIAVMYILIYLFVWIATYWLMKKSDNKINEALNEVRDEE